MGSTLRGKLAFFLSFAALGAASFEVLGWVKDPERQMPTSVRVPVGCVLGVVLGVVVAFLLGRMARDLELARTGERAVIRARLELGRLEPNGRFWLHWAVGDEAGARWVFEKQLRGPLPLDRLHPGMAHLAAAVELLRSDEDADETTRSASFARLRLPRRRWVAHTPALLEQARIAALVVAEGALKGDTSELLRVAREKLAEWQDDPEVLAYVTWLRERADEPVDPSEDAATVERAAALAARRGHVSLGEALARRATRVRSAKSSAAYR